MDLTPGVGAERPPAAATPQLGHQDAAQQSWMVRSEERAQVALPARVHARVRLVKHVVTEEVTQTFTLRREELRVEQGPGDEPGSELSWTYQFPERPGERDFEIVLHAERVVASTVVVPVERVRVSTVVVESATTVSTEIRREQIGVDHPVTKPAPPEAARIPEPEAHHGAATGSAAPTQEETR